MAKEAIAEIESVEEKAKQIREEAAAKAKAEVENTEKECRNFFDQEETKVRKEMVLKLANIRHEVDVSMQNAHADAQAKAEQKTQENQDKVDSAVRYIVRSVLDKWQF